MAHYYKKNLQGDVTAIVDSNGALKIGYKFDAWGNAASYCSNPNDLLSAITAALFFILNPFTYRGYFYDAESNIYYLQSRYYIPEWGRFLNADSTDVLQDAQGDAIRANPFAYCGNDPVNNIDPTGDWYKTYKVTILYGYDDKNKDGINDFDRPVNDIRYDFWNIFNYVKVDMDLFKNKQKFKDTWNALSNQDIVVIYSHGDPLGLNNLIGTDIINKLSFKYIKCLIILGCNCGHFGYIWNNVACAFSQKISGVVVASDGLVVPNSENHKFTSKGIDGWNYWRSKGVNPSVRKNNGWVFYKTANGIITCWYYNNLYTITMSSIIEYLKDRKLLIL